MFFVEQPCRCGTVCQPISLGPKRSPFKRLFMGLISLSAWGGSDRSMLDLTNCGDCASSQSQRLLLALGLRLAFIKFC